jgi:cytochrome c oxidase subunit I+III
VFSGLATLVLTIAWLWTTAEIPEKPSKPIGHGLEMPLYVSGSTAPGWWAMFITMLADATAWSGLVFGYLFFWTVRADFPPAAMSGPSPIALMAVLGLTAFGWAAAVGARETNRRGGVGIARLLLAAGAGALLVSIWVALDTLRAWGIDPESHSYPAIVWTLTIWMAAHAAVGAIALLYALARSLAGRATPIYDADFRNVALYQHFLLFSAVVTWPLLAFFPGLS